MKESCFKSRFCSKAGFTLIELLVVVLIIGILAAVAVPQYKKAVFKAQFSQLQISLDAIIKAQEVYRLENGTYADNLQDLALEIRVPSNITCSVGAPWDACTLYVLNPKRAVAGIERYQVTGKKVCCAYEGTQWIAESHCMSLMGATEKQTSNDSLHCYLQQ